MKKVMIFLFIISTGLIQSCTTKELARMSCENGLSDSIETRENCTETVTRLSEENTVSEKEQNKEDDAWQSHQDQEQKKNDDDAPLSIFDQ